MADKAPKVSIGLAVYNGERYLDEAYSFDPGANL